MDKEQVGIKTPEYISLQFQLAGLGSRAVAYIIDNLIMTFINMFLIIIAVLLFVASPELEAMLEANSYIIAILLIGLFLINWGYFFVLEFYWGGKTIGKKIMGIRVIQENGHSITLLSSLIRNLLRIIDQLPAYNLLGIIMIYFNSKKKRVGDLLAGTIVVYDERPKGNKKLSPIEKEIQARGLSKDNLQLEQWTLKAIDTKDWNLVRTYSNRYLQMAQNEKDELTKQVADIIFPKLGLEIENKNVNELENLLFVIYLHLKEEWEYEL
ncbi:RDD family protein [Bacillus niameyensis]|uniref:RDD family protein n=1 Tax=Bacillus niameyensis TaxID=1522308 RepID=UPI000780F19D|nr:RDD family protein [Bacillus niameyensis]